MAVVLVSLTTAHLHLDSVTQLLAVVAHAVVYRCYHVTVITSVNSPAVHAVVMIVIYYNNSSWLVVVLDNCVVSVCSSSTDNCHCDCHCDSLDSLHNVWTPPNLP